MVNTALPDWADTIIFLAAIAILVVPSSLGSSKRFPIPPVDVHHMSERAALLTLIMCGEAFVKVSLVVSNGSLSRTDVVAIVVEFIVVFAVFWTYFDDVPQAGIRTGKVRGEMWMLSHLPLQIGIVAIAVGMSKFLDVEHGVHDEVVGILGTGWAAVYGGLALIGLFGERRPMAPLLALTGRHRRGRRDVRARRLVHRLGRTEPLRGRARSAVRGPRGGGRVAAPADDGGDARPRRDRRGI